MTTAYADPDRPVVKKDPAVATVIAAGTTALGVASMYFAFRNQKAVMTGTEAMMFYGGLGLALFGPALGHVYARENRRDVAVLRPKVRTLTFLSRMIGAMFIFIDRINPDAAKGWELPLGISLAAGGTAIDIFDAHRAVRRYNRRFDVKIAPALQPTLTGSPAPGLVATGTF